MQPFAALVPLFALLAGVSAFTLSHTRPAPVTVPAQPARVKLAVLVVFDQMRGDYPARWRSLYGNGGFQRLMTEGAWFTDCHYPYGTTTTGPGHASILTGTCPDHHGIVNNNWNERGVDVYCAASSRYSIVPPPAVAKGVRPPAGGNPERLLSETVADVLKQTYGPRSKVFGLSLKDRSAILTTGKQPDGAFWFDGRLITSTYYTERLERRYPDWGRPFYRSNRVHQWFGTEWNKFRPDLDYARHSGPDDAPGEPANRQSFPHSLTGGKTAGSAYYNALAASPFGNELLLDIAKHCIVGENLGHDSVPDLLVVSFSSNDLIGHAWGPDSQEVLDVTLRTDALLADLLRFLDSRVGHGNYALALTADHGVCPIPEQSAAKGRNARRVSRPQIQERAEQYLRERFPNVEPSKARWIEAFPFPWIYLNPRLVKESGWSREEVAGTLARFLATQGDLETAFSRDDLAPETPIRSDVHRRMKRSFYPARCGDVCVVLKPFDLPTDKKPTDLLKVDSGTTHGSPFEYDAFVPLFVMGPGVVGGPHSEPVTPQAAAAIFSRFLGLRMPNHAEFPVPATLE
ncbi:MAG TPA: alkaline phosphatase family protein [Urbifossiella sp.]|nr:alkaline phosphatase family protein [Urbifossiella sp.]